MHLQQENYFYLPGKWWSTVKILIIFWIIFWLHLHATTNYFMPTQKISTKQFFKDFLNIYIYKIIKVTLHQHDSRSLA